MIAIALCALATAADRVGPPEAYPPPAVTGETDPYVTQENIHKTICVDHYTAGVRGVSAATKKFIMKRDGITVPAEVDHFISLELSGTNSDKNLWAEPYAGRYGARVKDAVENRLHKMVCASVDPMPLAVAQKCIAGDWILCGQQIGAIQK